MKRKRKQTHSRKVGKGNEQRPKRDSRPHSSRVRKALVDPHGWALGTAVHHERETGDMVQARRPRASLRARVQVTGALTCWPPVSAAAGGPRGCESLLPRLPGHPRAALHGRQHLCLYVVSFPNTEAVGTLARPPKICVRGGVGWGEVSPALGKAGPAAPPSSSASHTGRHSAVFRVNLFDLQEARVLPEPSPSAPRPGALVYGGDRGPRGPRTGHRRVQGQSLPRAGTVPAPSAAPRPGRPGVPWPAALPRLGGPCSALSLTPPLPCGGGLGPHGRGHSPRARASRVWVPRTPEFWTHRAGPVQASTGLFLRCVFTR